MFDMGGHGGPPLRVNAVLIVIPACGDAGIQGLPICLFWFFLFVLRFGILVCSGFRHAPE